MMEKTYNHLCGLLKPTLFAAVFVLSMGTVSTAQTTFSWRNDQNPTSGQWNVASYWWNGGAAELPGGVTTLFLDGSVGTTMTNDLPSLNRHKITFGAGGAARTINGSTENTFFEFGSTWPWIKNDATVKHTINFPIKASSNSGFNLELITTAGAIELSNTINNNGRTIQIYGNNGAVDAANRFVQLSGVLSGSGVLNVSQFGVAKLSAAHTYTGETQIDNGEIHVETGGSIASGSAIFIGNGGQLTNVTKLWLANATGGTTFSNNLTINLGNYQMRSLGGLNSSGTHTFSGTITNNAGNVSLSALTTGGTTAFTNTISGGGQVNIEGAGTVVLSGGNTYTGLSYITGKAQFNKSGGTTIPATNNVTVDGASASLKVSTNQTLNDLSVLNGANITVDDGVTLTINGTLTLTSGKITLGTGNIVVNALSGGSATAYIVTGGTGTVTQTHSAARVYPVGTATTYDPVTITPTGSATFAARVGGSISNPVSPRAGNSALILNRQWDLNRTAGSGSTGLAFTAATTSPNLDGSFTRPTNGSAAILGHWNGTGWDANIAATYNSNTWTIANYAGSFSPFIAASSGAVLAVEFTDINVKSKGNTNLLAWQTASEKDNSLFQIERSANATDFSPIGEVKGSGNSAAAKNYTFTDVAPLSGVNYYRLKAVDYNGLATLSKVVSVGFSGKNDTKVAVYPNPTRDVLRLDFNVADASTTLVQVSDLMGRVVLSQNISVAKGANLLPFNVASLPSGTYFVKVNGDVTRFVKQ